MMIGFYDMRVVAQMGEAGGGGLRASVAGVTIEGTTSKVIQTWTERLPITTDVGPIVNYGDGATSGTDPLRMRKLTNVTIVNTDAVTRTVRVSLETGAGIDPITGWLPMVAGGMVFYSPETGWVVYDAAGKTGNVGPVGPAGPTGAAGPAIVEWRAASVTITSARFAHHTVTVTDADVSPTSVLLAQLAPNADFDADDLADHSLTAEPTTGAVRFTISRYGPIVGTYRLIYGVGTP